jgi:carboxyl-terminal processing protease
MKRKLFYLLIPLVFVGIWIYLNRDKGNPIENFNYFFEVFEEKYALFDVKGIDWNKEYNQYSRQINKETTDDELFAIFKEILQKLEDKHCYIYRFNEIYFSGFGTESLNYINLLSFDFRKPTNDFSLKLIEKKYLIESEKSLRITSFLPPMGIRKVFTTGWLQDSVAYLHMTEMSNKADEVQLSIQSFLENHRNANGFVIDIRDNIGGYSLPVKELAEYFCLKDTVYAISRLRNPEDIFSFQQADYWELRSNPGSNYQNQQIALLTNQNTQSAAELFTLMMKTNPNVIQIGDTTSGIFGDTHIGKLPNGWEYRLSVRKTNNNNDKVLEDVGIIPDYLVLNTKQDLYNDKDAVLEFALHIVSQNI